MGYVVSISIDIRARESPECVIATLQGVGLETEEQDIHSDGGISYLTYSRYDHPLSDAGTERLIAAIMQLDPLPGKGPNLVFCDDLQQRMWGYRITARSVIPYRCVMVPDRRKASISGKKAT
jgi:hypothetical protein